MHWGSGDIVVVLVCHAISQGHMIKGSCDYMDMSPSRCATILPILVIIANQVVEFGGHRHSGNRDDVFSG